MENLSARDICEIIKSCKNSKVTRFKFGALELELDNAIAIAPMQPEPEMKFERLEAQEISDAQRLADLMVSNPSAYEEEIQRMDSEAMNGK